MSESIYKEISTDDTSWYVLADDYYYTAHVLAKNAALVFPIPQREGEAERIVVFQHNPFYLIMGVCIETLLKGIINDKIDIIQSGALRPKVKTHNLLKLFRKVNLESSTFFTEDEGRLLELLSEGMQWHNKYPGPIKEKFFDDFALKCRNENYYSNKEEHYSIFKTIYDKLLVFSNRTDIPDCRDEQIYM